MSYRDLISPASHVGEDSVAKAGSLTVTKHARPRAPTPRNRQAHVPRSFSMELDFTGGGFRRQTHRSVDRRFLTVEPLET